MFKVFFKELLSRGHELTAISAFPLNEKLANFTEILIEPSYSFGDECEYFEVRLKCADNNL